MRADVGAFPNPELNTLGTVMLIMGSREGSGNSVELGRVKGGLSEWRLVLGVLFSSLTGG